jgi:hypothetical protein
MERNMNEYSDLFYHCVQVLNEYDDNISEEVLLEEYFQANKVFILRGINLNESIIIGS